MKSQQRVKELGEVFTPPELVNQMLDKLPTDIWQDPAKTYIDPTCGNGNILVEIFARLVKYHTKEHILENQLFGADIMADNIMECIERLYGPGDIQPTDIPKEFQTPGILGMFTHNGQLVRNIVQADGLVYNYSFGRPIEFDEYTEELNQLFEWS